MSEPGTAPLGQAEAESLWHRAPGWRTLTVAASILTLVAVSLPILLPEETAPVPHSGLAALAPVQVANTVKPAPPSTPAPSPSVPQLSAPHSRVAAAIPARVPQKPEPSMPLQIPASQSPAQQPSLASAPQAASQSTAPVCGLRLGDTAPRLIGLGTIMGFEDHALSLARIQFTEANSGGRIDPDYVENQRVTVRRENGQVGVFIVPKGMSVQIGDRVLLQNGYRNMTLPCNYVPVQVASDIGPAPAPPEAPR